MRQIPFIDTAIGPMFTQLLATIDENEAKRLNASPPEQHAAIKAEFQTIRDQVAAIKNRPRPV